MVGDGPIEPLRLELEAPAEVSAGAPVRFALRLRNAGREPAIVYLRGREIAFDIVVTKPAGDTVWRRLSNAPIQAIAQVRRLGSAESLALEATWDQRDGAGRLVGAGEYRVRGVLFTDQERPMETAARTLLIGAAH